MKTKKIILLIISIFLLSSKSIFPYYDIFGVRWGENFEQTIERLHKKGVKSFLPERVTKLSKTYVENSEKGIYEIRDSSIGKYDYITSNDNDLDVRSFYYTINTKYSEEYIGIGFYEDKFDGIMLLTTQKTTYKGFLELRDKLVKKFGDVFTLDNPYESSKLFTYSKFPELLKNIKLTGTVEGTEGEKYQIKVTYKEQDGYKDGFLFIMHKK